MTHLRKMMLEELQRRNYSKHTAEAYIRALRDFAVFYNLPPDQLQPEQIRQYQLHLMREKGLAPKSVIQKMAAMKFFYSNVLRRSLCWNELPYPKTKNPLPIILSQDEVASIIDAASDLFQRAILMTLYSTGMRCEELAHLTIGDIDSKRMMVRIHQCACLRADPLLHAPRSMRHRGRQAGVRRAEGRQPPPDQPVDQGPAVPLDA